jgi:hypothetical protein
MRQSYEPSQTCCPDADAIRRDSFKVVLSHQNVAEAITVAPYPVAPKCRDHAIADLNLPSVQKSTTSTPDLPTQEPPSYDSMCTDVSFIWPM